MLTLLTLVVLLVSNSAQRVTSDSPDWSSSSMSGLEQASLWAALWAACALGAQIETSGT